MIAPFITVTGIDERTDVASAARLDAEIGILYTATPEGRNRYPRLDWIAEAALQLPRVAIHICGSNARRELIAGELDHVIALVQRIQVNGVMAIDEAEKICRRFPTRTVITQFNYSNTGLIKVAAENHAMLLDSSGGRGIAPQAWFCPQTTKPFGFAGGLGPNNLPSELPKIMAVASGSWWVDMEGNLREADWFSIEKAQQSVEIFHSLRRNCASPISA